MTKKEIRKLDKLFREHIRARDKKCQWCGSRRYPQVAHFISRRYRQTRWHPDNAALLCAGCHLKAHHRPLEFTEWVKKRLGNLMYEHIKELSYKIEKLGYTEYTKLFNYPKHIKSADSQTIKYEII